MAADPKRKPKFRIGQKVYVTVDGIMETAHIIGYEDDRIMWITDKGYFQFDEMTPAGREKGD